MFSFLVKLINYWYFRYLLVTELYMVEKWERVMIHIVLLIAITIISFFNVTVILGMVSYLTQNWFQDNRVQQQATGPSHI